MGGSIPRQRLAPPAFGIRGHAVPFLSHVEPGLPRDRINCGFGLLSALRCLGAIMFGGWFGHRLKKNLVFNSNSTVRTVARSGQKNGLEYFQVCSMFPGWNAAMLARRQVANFRAYIIGTDGHVSRRVDLPADTEPEARAMARQLVDGHAVELWELAKRIERFEPEQNAQPAVTEPSARATD